VLKDLLNTPIKELLLPRAEAGEETRPVLEATPSQDTVAINPEPHLPATAQRHAGVPPGDQTGGAASRPPEVEAKAGDDFRPEVNERPIASGRATFYEHPGRTASGEIFNPNELTAAHHTLPLGTRVRVVNEETGESVVVRINDRIPRTAKILIDLSRASAQAIRLPGAGQVTLYLAGDTSWPGSTLRASSGNSEQPPEGYDVQVTGSVSTEPAPQLARAERLLRLGDVAGARLVLEHIRLQGDPVATRRLAQTYDPDRLGAWRVVGLKGDPDKARQLYELAARTALNGNRSDLP
jgi:rare lipoprotein A (peptidoglycan hydrolase)